MDRDLSALEARIAELSLRLDDLARRLSAVEGALAERAAEEAANWPAHAPPQPAAAVGVTAAPAGALAPGALPAPGAAPAPGGAPALGATGAAIILTGRTLVILGGAYLLRAVTEWELVPRAAGIVLGLLYAVAWLLFADRAAARGRIQSAFFHGLGTAVIAFPLLWETTAGRELRFFSPPASATVLGAISLLAFFVAWRRDLAGLAWVAAAGAVPAAVALACATEMAPPFLFCVVALGGATLWLAYLRGWEELAWLTAGAVDLAVLAVTALLLVNPRHQSVGSLTPPALLAVQLALLLAYCGSLLSRTLWKRAEVTSVEIVQAAAVLVVGLGGAVALARSSRTLSLPLGAVSLALAAGSYAVSFTFMDRRLESRRSFIFYSTLALEPLEALPRRLLARGRGPGRRGAESIGRRPALGPAVDPVPLARPVRLRAHRRAAPPAARAVRGVPRPDSPDRIPGRRPCVPRRRWTTSWP
ncbi:MAG: hypothetical protein HY721_23500 [Planctomycetes bacterium]|nr:hypothetical protein [Planctomycetota bacterium]